MELNAQTLRYLEIREEVKKITKEITRLQNELSDLAYELGELEIHHGVNLAYIRRLEEEGLLDDGS
ncbi:MAG: hypothetical protein M0Q54_09030 [Pigmentiphaga sp.]|nr:hypothetical protein [Pigmentiphaga sp.]